MKTYLVTGGCGFIGSNFVRHMIEKGGVKILNLDALTYAGNPDNLSDIENDPNYSLIKGDIVDTEAVETLFENYDINAVINFAAETHVDRSIKNPVIFGRTNALGALNVLNIAKKAWEGRGGFKKGSVFLQVSTDEVYGSLGTVGHFVEGSCIDPHSPYSASKASADVFVQAYGSTYRMPILITRCSNNYGPNQHHEKLIPLMISNALDRKPLIIYGDGLHVRDWMYVEDTCKALNALLESGKSNEIYNVGAHNERSNKEIVHFIVDYVHRNHDSEVDDSLIQHTIDRRGHGRRYAVDTSKIKRDIGWEPTTSFDNGMIKTIEWYAHNRSWMAAEFH
jgi:dTDP-glucose 4,6-dehydratase